MSTCLFFNWHYHRRSLVCADHNDGTSQKKLQHQSQKKIRTYTYKRKIRPPSRVTTTHNTTIINKQHRHTARKKHTCRRRFRHRRRRHRRGCRCRRCRRFRLLPPRPSARTTQRSRGRCCCRRCRPFARRNRRRRRRRRTLCCRFFLRNLNDFCTLLWDNPTRDATYVLFRGQVHRRVSGGVISRYGATARGCRWW